MLRIENFTLEASEASHRENLNVLDERRAEAHLKNLHYQRTVARLYNQREKLAPRWEGSYRVTQVVRDETYTLSTTDGKTLLGLGMCQI
ncbi:hypothetical protein BHM03_00032030 [Ensete ventricosum]|nr:hypothetical protein BHM03_00032030 [Ensete ventricosum]